MPFTPSPLPLSVISQKKSLWLIDASLPRFRHKSLFALRCLALQCSFTSVSLTSFECHWININVSLLEDNKKRDLLQYELWHFPRPQTTPPLYRLYQTPSLCENALTRIVYDLKSHHCILLDTLQCIKNVFFPTILQERRRYQCANLFLVPSTY